MPYDAHIHKKNKESGGFVIGLEGEPQFKDVLNNLNALKLHNFNNNYVVFYYVIKNEIEKKIQHKYLKYHPRREKYTVEEVINSIEINKPNAVIIDTLNEPFWVPYDYWKIAKNFFDIKFIFAHSGGYLINDFIKICHFQPNVWLDFSLTHTSLGHYGDSSIGLEYVNGAIKYALHGPFNNRILLGSDFPFFNQADVFSYYKNYLELLDNNFLKLKEEIK